ncbi:MAG TPA: ATP-binding protein [Kamptonema sp.]|nr:ATP-binding protein [Kamptonema sp.]
MALVKIVIVEDETIIALDLKSSLNKFGYEVVGIFSSGERVLEKIGEIQPDLVLMDILLKGNMDGVQTAEKITRNFQIPIVFLTAHTDETSLQRAKETYPFGYIVKPFEERDLYTTVEIALYRAKAESEIRKALEKEKELNELKSRFVSMVSHEFRTPLATILFSAGMLENYGQKWSEDKRITHLRRIQTAVKQMTGLLEDILIIGNSEVGKLDFKPVNFDLKNFCIEIVEELQMMAEKHQLVFKFNGSISEVKLDEKLMRYILYNLLSNAIKYSPKGGRISFELFIGEPEIKTPDFTLIGDTKVVIFWIKDEGIGIPLEDRQQIFETFYRARNVGTISGTGLGLAIVKKSVELHGGEIEVYSEVGVGTTIIVTLPLQI